jgi:hypothetical protein
LNLEDCGVSFEEKAERRKKRRKHGRKGGRNVILTVSRTFIHGTK